MSDEDLHACIHHEEDRQKLSKDAEVKARFM